MESRSGVRHPEILFANGRARLRLGDCLRAMANMPDDSIDHVITDPPFEKHMHRGKAEQPRGRKIRGDGYAELQVVNFDSIEPIRQDAASEMVRVSRGWLLVFCTPEGVAPWRDAIEAAGGRYKRACFWDKPDGAPQFNGQGPAMPGESFVCAWCGPGHSKWNGGGKRGMYCHNTNNRDRDGRHPTEKPVSLMRELLRDFTNKDEIVLDPFMGSGTTGVAALIEGRRFAGVDMSEEWFSVAQQRIGWLVDGKGPIVRASERTASMAHAALEDDLLSGVAQ